MFIDRKKPPHKNLEKKMAKEHFLTFLLWLISKKEQHGYEIIKILKSDRHIPSVAISKIYPLLKELHKRGFVSQKKIMYGRRARKLYSLTPKGKEALKRAKQHMTSSPLFVEFMEDMLK